MEEIPKGNIFLSNLNEELLIERADYFFCFSKTTPFMVKPSLLRTPISYFISSFGFFFY